MTLDRLLGEIQSTAEARIAEIEREAGAESARLLAERDREIAQLEAEAERVATQEGSREKVQRVAAAKLRARQMINEARETRIEQALRETRSVLAEFTSSPEYPRVLERMSASAVQELGPSVKIRGRKEDAAGLGKAAGSRFDARPVAILGGVIAESADGRRQLNLSFDELLRLREERVRALLSR